MREVMISIQPKWVEKICHKIGEEKGKPIYEKRIEIRKTKPKCEVPFKCYIYCTQGKFADLGIIGNEIYQKRMKVIGEFVCDRITKYECSSVGFGELATTCGTCLTYDEILNYCNGNDLYGWHISDLVVYDEPRELSEFKTPDWYADCEKCNYLEKMRCPVKDSHKANIMATACRRVGKPITRPPQSWQFCVATEPRQTAD